MRLCRSSQADMNGLTYSAASRSRLVWRSCSCDSAHVQTAHSPIATEMSHCMGSSPPHSSRCGSFSRSGSRRFSVASPGASEIMNASYYRWGPDILRHGAIRWLLPPPVRERLPGADRRDKVLAHEPPRPHRCELRAAVPPGVSPALRLDLSRPGRDGPRRAAHRLS